MQILLACPVQNRDWVLPHYLNTVLDLEYDKKLIDIYWVVNNSTDDSLILLQTFKKLYGDLYNSITIEEYNNSKVQPDVRTKLQRRSSTYYWLAELRNKLLGKCVQLNCDYLLSSDCDIMLRPDTLKRLLEHKQHCVAALIYNGYNINAKEPYRFANILNKNGDKYEHIVTARTKKPLANPVGKTINVDFTGACILISKEVASKVKYGYYYLGEDGYFCRSAQKQGYTLLCDVSLFNYHIMSQDLLADYYMEVQNGKNIFKPS